MKNMKISSVSTFNFKGFKELHISFDGKTAVMLGGMNGYGKTTVFDALELLFTGEIHRMTDYASLHDSRGTLNQEYLPLVYSKELSHVMVTARLTVNGEAITICRVAKVSDMKNPVDFSAFSKIMRVGENQEEQPISEEEYSRFGLDCLEGQYSFLNYLSQEEATAFLKSKEVDRAKVISELFNLEYYDAPISRIDKILKDSLKGKIAETERSISDVNNKISALKQVTVEGSGEEVKYEAITTGNQFWDAQAPRLTNEQFNEFLGEGGVMDKLVYYCQNKEAYRQYRINNAIEKLTDGPRIDDIAFWIKNSENESIFKLYRDCQSKIFSPIAVLTLQSLGKFNINIQDNLRDVISEEVITEFNSRKSSLLSIYNSTNVAQQEILAMLQTREDLAEEVIRIGDNLDPTECPLCGRKYDNIHDLVTDMEEHKTKLAKALSEVNENIQKQFSDLKTYLVQHVSIPIKDYFLGKGITDEKVNRYENIDKSKVERDLRFITESLRLTVDTSKEEGALESSLIQQMLAVHKDDMPEVNYGQLEATFNGYARYIKKDCLTVEIINAKRNYLLMTWNKLQSTLMQGYQKDLDKARHRDSKLAELKGNLEKLKKELADKRQHYFSTLLKDIQILFYIYSGRIMQTNYFGRGLFIKPDEKCKHIIFTSSANNDVDALYNMSSGQLVAMTVALLLSLNKLYGEVNILAIDDPIQTIDDINLWGMIETLRHDFNDHFLLLSTHEHDYGDLLAYKFAKWGISTKVIDMAQTDSER